MAVGATPEPISAREAALVSQAAPETDILRTVASGNTNKEIANELRINVATVERHLANVHAKIVARGRPKQLKLQLSPSDMRAGRSG